MLCAMSYSHSKRPRAKVVKMEKQENRDIRDLDAKQLCAVVREERAEGLARAGMGNNAARKRRAIAVLITQ